MAKPKIDLKARLGRRGVAPQAPAVGGSIPPPAGVGAPSGPPSGGPMSGGVPAPSMGVPAPAPTSYDAMGVPAVQAAPRAEALPGSTGPFELDEDFAAAQRGSSGRKFLAVAVAASVVGVGLGYAWGGGAERSKGHEVAEQGAQMIIKDITAANAEVKKLSDVLESAANTLKSGKFPEEEVNSLASINIPFDGTNLQQRGIGRFRGPVGRMLFTYTAEVAKANAQKEKIRSLLSFAQKPVEQMLAERDNPQVRWGVYLQDGPQGPWANMQMLPDSFPVKGDERWPSSFELKEGKETYNLPRYTGGDPMRRGTAKLIPVAPQTQGAVCPTDTVIKIRRELSSMQEILMGDQTPGRETQGIVELGEAIKKELSKIGRDS